MPPLLFVATLVAACGPDVSQTPDGGRSATPTNEASGFLEDSGFLEELPRFGLEPELRIGGRAAGLVSVSWVRVAPQGTMAVSQLLQYRISLFDAEGGDLGSLGGPGVGPEESLGMGGAGWIGDTLWVSDATLGRIALFSRERELLRTLLPLVAARPEAGEEDRYPVFLSVYPLAVYAGDTLLVMAEGAVGDPPPEALAQGAHLLLTSSDGRIQRHVLQLPASGDLIEVRVDGRSSTARVPLSPVPHWTVAPDGGRIALLTTEMDGSEGGIWRLQLLDAGGGELFVRSFPFQGIPIPGPVMESLLESPNAGVPDDRLRSAVRKEVRRRIPPAYPPVTGLRIGADDRIWVQLREAAEEYFWLVLSPEGDPIGRVVLPEFAELQAADSARLWVSEVGQEGVPGVVRYRIVEVG